jgi:hypothetical protein
MNNGIATIKAIQGLLGVTQDGIFGPKSQQALTDLINLSKTPDTVYSKTFTDFMPWILDWEGRTFENDPNDPGGATKYGIDQRSHPNVDIRNLTEPEAIAIYWNEWIEDGCLNLQSPYAEVYFNCAVNMGLSRAKEFDIASKGDPKTFLALQEAKYRSIAANNSNLKGFLKGWLNRTESLRERFSI